MARYIEAVTAAEIISEKCDIPLGDLVDVFAEIPTADVVEVVRCRDCKHSAFVKSCSKYECRKGCGTLKYSNDFCSYGERKAE